MCNRPALFAQAVFWGGEEVPAVWQAAGVGIEDVAVFRTQGMTEVVCLARGAVRPGENTLVAMDIGNVLLSDTHLVTCTL